MATSPKDATAHELSTPTFAPIELHVALTGDDANPGTPDAPLATLASAQQAARRIKPRLAPVHVIVHGGTHYLSRTLELEPRDSGTPEAPIRYQAAPGERVTLSGGIRLSCAWEPYRDGIMKCKVTDPRAIAEGFTQLFVNGRRQIRARYPNYDGSDLKNFTGYTLPAGAIDDSVPDPLPDRDADMTFSGPPPRGIVFNPARFTSRTWARPGEAVIHIFQGHSWGNLQYQVKHIDPERRHIWFGRGGHQMGAKWYENPAIANKHSHFFIENIFEELDAPGEWYFDRAGSVLYHFPEPGTRLDQAVIEFPLLRTLIAMRGTQQDPVHDVRFTGFRFAHTASTFMDEYEVPSLSDWSIHRGGTVFLEGTRNCVVENCWFDATGGNAVFVNNFNRSTRVTGCTFSDLGESAVCFVGRLENTIGAQKMFPYECGADDNLIRRCGVFGKQVAGVYISRAKRISVAHNLIHDMPRAGVCIGDGTWGGHVIEFNHIHDTCLETGDHGPFNAWGRDRGWCLTQSHAKYTCDRSHDAHQMLVDVMEPVIVRNNFFVEKAGWGLDLDDGASNYQIYNNLCVGVSMKLREGCQRTVFNNIWVNGANSPCFHVGNEDNYDRYFRNITVMSVRGSRPEDDLNFAMGKSRGEIYTLIAPPCRSPWLQEIDHNCFFSDVGEFRARVVEREKPSRMMNLDQWREQGFDRHSVFADPLFIDPAHNDYRVRPESPALAVGFENFPMGQWGLTPQFPKAWWSDAPHRGTP